MKHGFRVLDSDLHTMEPDGLWEQYLEEPFSNKTKAKILWDNCARLYKLPASA